jgi:Fe-S cluster assembly ATPase SufC
MDKAQPLLQVQRLSLARQEPARLEGLSVSDYLALSRPEASLEQSENIPQVIVGKDQAQITHGAAIGRVNKKELETLMARGLDEDAAVDVIVRGMLS